jgi:hypothetical protein
MLVREAEVSQRDLVPYFDALIAKIA